MKVKYTLKEFFAISPITQEAVAKEAKISANLMRQYAGEFKLPSEKRLKDIEDAIHRIGGRLIKYRFHKPSSSN